jgi:purine nucleoside phosphorylase
MVTGASTIPEQIAAGIMGVKTLGIAAVSNPATGTIEGWVHEQEFYIQSAKRCIESLKKIIWKVIERYEVKS